MGSGGGREVLTEPSSILLSPCGSKQPSSISTDSDWSQIELVGIIRNVVICYIFNCLLKDVDMH